MYMYQNDCLFSVNCSYSRFTKRVAELRAHDGARHDDTIYRWYKDDNALINDRPTKILINRGEHYRDHMED